MKYIVYLATLLLFSTAKAQNPTIIKGDYVSNVFGQSNFVLNPNAQTGIGNISSSSATVTRSTTTPLVATTEFNWNASAGGFSTWSLRAFDAGMKNQNCEARFTYRGFTAGTTTAQVRNSGIVIAELVLTPSATDPRIASINFPCGDLSLSTNFRLLQSGATLGGINEIGGIYVGLATNMANIAQAEMVGGLTTSSLVSRVVGPANVWTDFTGTSGVATPIGKATSGSTSMSVTFPNLPAGEYQVVMNQPFFIYGGSAAHSCRLAIYETNSGIRQVIHHSGSVVAAAAYTAIQAQTTARFSFTTAGSRTFKLQANNQGWSQSANGECYAEGNQSGGIFVYRFPSSSELVVTPETQGDWWISGAFTGGLPQLGLTTASNFGFNEITNSSLSFIPDSGSQPVATVCSSTNAPPALSTSTTTCAAGDESVGLTFNVPSVGAYEVCTEFTHSVAVGANGNVDDTFALQETALNNNVALTLKSGINSGHSHTTAVEVFFNTPLKICDTFNFTSIGQKAVRLMYAYGHTAPINQNLLIANNSQGKRNIKFTVQPITNKANSALYVQGPVKAAGTGAAIPAGYVGEEILNSTPIVSTLTTTANVEINVTNATITLGPGVWDLEYNVQVGAYRTPASASSFYCRVRLKENGTPMADTEKFHGTYNSLSSVNNTYAQLVLKKRVYITSGTNTYQLTVEGSGNNTIGFCAAESGHMTGSFSGDDTHSYVRAVRVN